MAIQITNEQLKKLDDQAFELYISELIEHCQLCYPNLVDYITTTKLRAILANEVKKIKQQEINQRASVRFQIDLMIIFGTGFKTDPQYAWINQWLEQNAHYSQLEQADFLFEDCVDYLKAVYGENNINKYLADSKLDCFDLNHYVLTKENFDSDILIILQNIYPKKAELAGDNALQNLITQAKHTASLEFSATYIDQYAYFIIASYLYGHQFYDDPFLPNITAIKNSDDTDFDYANHNLNTQQHYANVIEHWSSLKSL
ncbi:hypothetical protein [Gilliamella apis]|uniref:Uncharacterized protein n=1 Tax=Gilliamella apis TaxID=1970738 RepID=A0A242NWS3_9GAMM|nr:hypothetical protein [Gilliamella apis]OTQ52721.1 hypothetical protein B6D06_01740 [Gilliamella apis]